MAFSAGVLLMYLPEEPAFRWGSTTVGQYIGWAAVAGSGTLGWAAVRWGSTLGSQWYRGAVRWQECQGQGCTTAGWVICGLIAAVLSEMGW